MAGLQGSGKTTACAKLAQLPASRTASTSLLVACDVYRPAAIEQLADARRARSASPSTRRAPTATRVEIAREGARPGRARRHATSLIVDTAGRLHVDEELMDELADITRRGRSRTTCCSSSTR